MAYSLLDILNGKPIDFTGSGASRSLSVTVENFIGEVSVDTFEYASLSEDFYCCEFQGALRSQKNHYKPYAHCISGYRVQMFLSQSQ